jgi:4-alpha-glucanotransferase
MEKITIKTIGPWMPHGQQVYITGNCPALGNWNPKKALPMTPTQGIIWHIDLDAKDLPEGFEFKFLRKELDGSFTWETCFNRTNPYEVTETCFPGQHPRYAGTAIPVFSLRSQQSAGIGDFLDIKLMIDWAASTGQAVLQLLPVNDTTSTKTWTDSYPYGGITIMALHPIYLNLKDIGPLHDTKAQAEFEEEAAELNAMPQLDYERVFDLKEKYTRAIFAQKGTRTMASKAFRAFLEANRDWLMPYAAFCVLRDHFKTADFTKWKRLKKYSKAGVSRLYTEATAKMDYYIFVQYHLDRQLREVHDYARSKGVALKGDIPIGITPHSVEAWAEPEYFNMGEQAGAPPDAFAVDGQNWGFPTYNWDRMAKDGYAWWKRRFRKMAEYFDAYRIDHVLGFFRIWEIPVPYKSGLMGHFSPALPYSADDLRWRGFPFDEGRHARPYAEDDPCEVLFLEDPVQKGMWHPRISAQYTRSYNDLQQWEKDAFNHIYDEFFYTRNTEFWREQAMRKLPELISATDMLTCAEDLGMIPACVPEVLDQLHILSLEVQRMPKDPKQMLGNPSEYPYMSVCTTGSHDTSTLRGWWGENHHGEDCPVDVCEWIVAEHLYSPAMLTILPLQDWFSLDPSMRVEDVESERINVPANPKHYWRWRMHLTLEEMIANKAFNQKVAGMIDRSGRKA